MKKGKNSTRHKNPSEKFDRPRAGWNHYDPKVNLEPLDVYDELRKAHLIIRSLYEQVTGQDKSDQNLDSFLVSAVETVHGVLYLAEAEAVRAENEE
jgi:hypothetical protein